MSKSNDQIKSIIRGTRLKSREASKASAWLNGKETGTKISSSFCYKSTPLQIAREFLGTNAKDSQVESLAVEIATEVGLIEEIEFTRAS